MLFNSIPFAIFLPIVYLIYWSIGARRFKIQNFMLILASYVFYGWWDWRFLSLIFISSLVDYVVGGRMDRSTNQSTRKILLLISIFVNLGILGFFKYFNFFIDSFACLLGTFGLQANMPTLRIILPVGISFYTFQTLSYTIDIYREKIKSTGDPIAFFAFVSFFPQLVAGPIERAKSLLPQFTQVRQFDDSNARDGVRQMLWGFFKKMVVADNLAPHVEFIFENYATLDSITLFLGVFFFALQIYCDFSGYSDIAIGIARLFGFSLMRNFAFPYFSRDIAEFWRRWHISLSSWFRDYVYIPLGGSYVGKWQRIRNIIITFTVSGFWHGANWTFVIWGLLNGLYYIPIMLKEKQKRYTDTIAPGRLFPGIREAGAILLTFLLALLAWVFFRADSLSHAFGYLGQFFRMPFTGSGYSDYLRPLCLAIIPLVIEWLQRDKQHGLEISLLPLVVRWMIYAIVCFGILLFGSFGFQQFIYFQF
ncbi:MAG: MBOAT family O-acyltransferase [Candidatus Electryonea clarkiae]|nr:MBOAT family O-acyltransferase [Candidatus Electryonea clarkiae]MDP8289315.1 MBOAT family O-acyltransferase [Candidatus Electryonea clarkiae]